MNGKDFSEVVKLIVKEDSRFDKGAYYFMRKALDYTLKDLKQDKSNQPNNHVTGQQLLDGIGKFASEQYGPMTMTVFRDWGITQSIDFGDIVFNLVEYGVFGKTESDSREDFRDGLDFNQTFVEPFLPNCRGNKPDAKTISPSSDDAGTPEHEKSQDEDAPHKNNEQEPEDS